MYWGWIEGSPTEPEDRLSMAEAIDEGFMRFAR